MRFCKKCNMRKKNECFTKGRNDCKDCQRVQKQKWKANNPEKYEAQKARQRKGSNGDLFVARKKPVVKQSLTTWQKIKLFFKNMLK